MPFQMYFGKIHRSMARSDTRVFPGPDNPVLCEARRFTYRLIELFWNEICQAFGSHVLPLPELPPNLAEHLADCTVDESLLSASAQALPMCYSIQTAYDITAKYASLLPSDVRGKHGIFYTPPSLVDRLLDDAANQGVDWSNCTVLDPACGGGAFLAPVAMRKREALRTMNNRERIMAIGKTVRGMEIDPFAAWMTQVLTELAVIEDVILSRERLPNLITVCDALRSEPQPSGFDLVVGNPPYGRASLSKDDREIYQRGLYGHANLYGLFTDLALRAARPGGTVALVTPASYLAGQYFKNLRKTIRSVASPRQIDFIKQRTGTFEGVLQETVISIHVKIPQQTGGNRAYLLDLKKDGTLHTTGTGQISFPKKKDAPWIIPRSGEAKQILEKISSDGCHLRDYGYRVRTGPLVWNRHRDQLCRTRVNGAFPLVWAESVRAGGKFEFSYVKRNHAPFFLPEDDQEWLLTRSQCVLLQRTTSKEQNRRLVAAVLPYSFIQDYGAAVIENHLNVIEPATDDPAAIAPGTMAFLLNSPLLDQIFRCISGSVAVSAYELESMPLPPPDLIAEIERDTTLMSGYEQFEKKLEGYYGLAS